MADYAIHDTTLESIANTIRKKDGTSALIDPATYAERVNLMGLLEEKTASSASICSFSDGADDVPMSSAIAHIAPTLTGKNAVNMVQSGKNLLDMTVYDGGIYNPAIGTTINLTPSSSQFTKTGNAYSIDTTTEWKTFAVRMPVKAGVTYYIKYTMSASGETLGSSEYYLDADNKVINSAWNTTSNPYTRTRSSTAPSNSTWFVITFTNRGTATNTLTITEPQIEVGSTATEFEQYKQPTTYTANLGRTVYGGQADIVNGIGTDENGDDFTFDGQEIPSLLGVNNLWHDAGDTEAVYRSSGTVTPVPIQPVLISKTITENGVYSAEDDDADGYDEVTVTVQSATCERLMYARCVNNDQEEIPAISNIDQGANYSTYLSYDSTTKKFTVLQNFTGVVIAWVYAYRAYEASRPDGSFYVNNTQMLSYTATGNAAGSTGGRSGIYNFKQGDTFWMYTPTRRGYPQQNCKVYLVSELDDDVFTFADEGEEENEQNESV